MARHNYPAIYDTGRNGATVATFSDMPENETGRGNPESLMKMAAEALALHLYRLIKTHGATAIRYPNRRIRAGHIFRRIRLKENPPPGYRREPGRFTANRPREDHVKDN